MADGDYIHRIKVEKVKQRRETPIISVRFELHRTFNNSFDYLSTFDFSLDSTPKQK